ELDVRRRSGDERLRAAKRLVVFLRRCVAPRDPRNDGAVRKWKRSGAIRLDRDVVPKDGAQVVEIAFFVGDGDQPPVTVPGRNLRDENRCTLSLGMSRHGCDGGDHADNGGTWSQPASDSFHTAVLPGGASDTIWHVQTLSNCRRRSPQCRKRAPSTATHDGFGL